MKNNELSNQISMNEIYGLGIHPENRLMFIHEVLLDAFFGVDSNLSAKASRIILFYFSRIFKDDPEKYYVVLTRENLTDLCQDQELKDLYKIIDEIKSCYIKIKAVSGDDELSREVAAFEFGYRRNKDNRRLKEFILSCNTLPEIKDLFFNLVNGDYFTGVYKLVSELKGNDKNVRRTIRVYWYLKKNLVKKSWFVTNEELIRILDNDTLSIKNTDNLIKIIDFVGCNIVKHSDLRVSFVPQQEGKSHKIVGFNITCSEYKLITSNRKIEVSDYELDIDLIKSLITSPGLAKMSDIVICQCYKALEEKIKSDFNGKDLNLEICKTLNSIIERAVAQDKKKRDAKKKPIVSYDNYVKGAVDKYKVGKAYRGNNPRKTGAEAGITVESQPENNQGTPLEKSSKDDDSHDFSDPILDLFQSHWDDEEDL